MSRMLGALLLQAAQLAPLSDAAPLAQSTTDSLDRCLQDAHPWQEPCTQTFSFGAM